MISLIGWLFRATLLLVLLSLLWVLAYRWVNPPASFIMLRDSAQGIAVKREWVPLGNISRHLPRSVIAAEDSRFCQHRGFDVEAIEQAMERNREGGRLRGGSTISQQTAKNVFLWPGRNFVRKGLEAWFTFWIERLWGKPRIMEVYLNVIEFDRGVYGAEAAARHHFDTSAARLTAVEAARLAAVLPQPVKRDAGNPGPYVRRQSATIVRRAQVVARDGLDACLKG